MATSSYVAKATLIFQGGFFLTWLAQKSENIQEMSSDTTHFPHRLAILIDGGYLNHLTKLADVRIDHQRLVQHIKECVNPNIEVLRTYYYDCLPYQDKEPTKRQSEAFGKKQAFLYALQHLPRFEVREGRVEKRNDDYEQKMVDILLSVDLMRLSFRHQVTNVALVTGDSDFVPAICAARDEGVIVWIFYGDESNCHRALLEKSDEQVRLTPEVLRSIEKH